MECEGRGKRFDPIATRWRCPFCGLKAACCGGMSRVILHPDMEGGVLLVD